MRYNRAKTLQVLFQEDYTPRGKGRLTDRGILMLRKPGRMRWDYSQPPGKLVVSDNKTLWVTSIPNNAVYAYDVATLKNTGNAVALVAQDTYLFNNTLWENLKLGRVDATDEEIMEAATDGAWIYQAEAALDTGALPPGRT